MLELLILTALGLWLAAALRFCRRQKSGCGGNCARCSRCGKSPEYRNAAALRQADAGRRFAPAPPPGRTDTGPSTP